MQSSPYSGQKSYHDMLRNAQSVSPALTFILCKLLLSAPEITDEGLVASETFSVDHGEFATYFSDKSESSLMSQFLKEVFKGFNVHISWTDMYGKSQRLLADKQFVQWLQSGVVEMHDSEHLITITT